MKSGKSFNLKSFSIIKVLPFISAILYPLVFPKFNLYFMFPFIFTALIIFSSKCSDKKNVFLYSWGAGILSNIIMLYWLHPTMLMNEVGYLSAYIGLFLFSAYLGLYWGVFGLAIFYITKLKLRYRLFLIPATWIFLEYIKTYLFTGFPWLLAGYSLWKIPELLQIASVTGIYGLSFFVVLINTITAESLTSKKVKPIFIALLLIVILYIYGSIAINRLDINPGYKVSILQGNISQYKKYKSRYNEEILNVYSQLNKKTAENKPYLTVWPETSTPKAISTNIDMENFIKRLAENSGAYHIVGSVEQGRGYYYNSAYTVSPTGEISKPYRKIHILPFGEYFPFRSIISLFADIINELGDFDAGSEYKILEAGDFNAGTGICFESILPGLVRNFFKNGANIFVNITNDAWFLKTAGPYQHFIHSVVRAVENRTYVIRSANTGISAIISPAGRIMKKTELLETTVLNGMAGINEENTLYTAYGDIFTFACFLITIVMILIGYRRIENV